MRELDPRKYRLDIPECANCKSKNELKINIYNKLFCGHYFCNSCAEISNAKCKICGVVVSKTLKNLTLDQSICKRDLQNREEVFNAQYKERKDFATLREYNDYLEKVEDVIYQLNYSEESNYEEKSISDVSRARTERRQQYVKEEKRILLNENAIQSEKLKEYLENMKVQKAEAALGKRESVSLEEFYEIERKGKEEKEKKRMGLEVLEPLKLSNSPGKNKIKHKYDNYFNNIEKFDVQQSKMTIERSRAGGFTQKIVEERNWRSAFSSLLGDSFQEGQKY